MVTSPSCGTGSGKPETPCASASTSKALATGDQLGAQRGERDVVAEWHRRTAYTGPVEPLFHLHQADTGLVVAGEDGALDRRRAAPAGQEREVQVHHRDLPEQPRRDDAAVRHHDRELDAGGRQVVHVVGDGQPSSVAASLTGLGVASCPGRGGGRAGDAECDVVAGVDQGAQRRHSHVGGAEVRQPGHPFTVGQRVATTWWDGRPGAGVSG